MTQNDSCYDKHRERLDAADQACRSRGAYSPFIESPKGSLHPDGAKQRGLSWYEATLGGALEDTAPVGSSSAVAAEVSPYTGEALGVSYARPSVDSIFRALAQAWPAWRAASPERRLGVCLEALDRLAAAVFDNAFATMHTTGQGFMMAFAGSGANSLDRGLEALVYARRAMSDVPREGSFTRRFGRAEVTLRKRYRLMPRGVGLVIACGSYPAWNAYPALMASLATGNPVVLKPHPTTILPLARATQIIRGALADAGFDPNLLVLATDTAEAPLTDALVDHPQTAIVDFTGSPEYGARLERRADRLVYTETAGCNALIVESVRDLDAALGAIASSLCLFSGQMCTTPQNIYVPPQVQTEDGEVGYGELRERLIAKVDGLLADPARAAAICGALHSPRTAERVDALQASRAAQVARLSQPYLHPEHAAARTRTPLILEERPDGELHREEHFGPVAFLIAAPSRDAAMAQAAAEARQHGAIASYAYSTDGAFRDATEQAFFDAGASIGFNLIGQAPINFTAAFSDYHVTGLNPAGNASLTDLAFVANRFRIVQSKTELV
jgi:phenylacetic acid degradation protein paaN